MKATEFKKSQAQHIMIFGDPGTGKSMLVLQLLEAGYKIKYFCIDGGIPDGFVDSKGKERLLKQNELERLEIFMLRDTPSFQVGQQTFRKVIKGDSLNICDYHGQVNCSVCRKAELSFSTVCLNDMHLDEIAVFDHLTAFSKSVLNTLWDGETFSSNISGDAGKEDGTSYTIFRQQGWLENDFLSRQQVAPFNTIVIAEQMMVEMEDNKKKLVPSCGTKDFSATVGSYFGNIIHASVVNGKHRFGSKSTYQNGVITKSRSGFEIEKMEVPSLAPLFLPIEQARVSKPEMPIGKQSSVATDQQLKDLVVTDSKVSSGRLADLKNKLKSGG